MVYPASLFKKCCPGLQYLPEFVKKIAQGYNLLMQNT